MKRLYHSREDKVISGVCGGIAEYLDVDPTIVRVVTALAVVFTGIPGPSLPNSLDSNPRAPTVANFENFS